MATYKTFTTLGDFGPWVSKLILDLPCGVRADEVSPATFNVFCTRRETADVAGLARSAEPGLRRGTRRLPLHREGRPAARVRARGA